MIQELPHKPRFHIFICINDRDHIPENSTPSCGPTITENDVKHLKLWLRTQGLAGQVFCTKTKCLGFCNEQGGVIAIYPEGRFLKGFQNVEEIKTVLRDTLDRTQ